MVGKGQILAVGALVISLPLLMLPSGCSSIERQARAQAFLDDYMAALGTTPVEQLGPFYADQFFTTTSHQDWADKRSRVEQQLGARISHRVAKWTMEVLPNGTFTTFVCDVTYANDTAHETITVVEPIKDHEPKIFGHHIRSALLSPAEPIP